MIDFKLFWGFDNGLTDGRTDICTSRVAFATENLLASGIYSFYLRLSIVGLSNFHLCGSYSCAVGIGFQWNLMALRTGLLCCPHQ